ncbi:MAG: precorrin-6y C5,15-methyltransferase (decarboxylating) subunit CbiE [Caldimicrobium sp.]
MKINLLGIGYKPFTNSEEEVLKKVEAIFLFPATLETFKNYPLYEKVKEKIKIIRNIKEFLSEIENYKDREVGFLATGDPLCYGIGETLLKKFPKETLVVYPDLSTPQVFCARLKIPFYKVRILSFHGRPFDGLKLLREISNHPYLFLFTDPHNRPAEILKFLEENACSQVKVYVGENLGRSNERIYRGVPKDFIHNTFEEPNCILIENPFFGSELLFGIVEDELIHKEGLITKDEIRAIVLHKLLIPKRGVFWDIGAGSGSVSIEVGKLNPELQIYAIDKDEDQIKCLEMNLKKFMVSNVQVIRGEAPEVLYKLSHPDRIFLGGSGGKLKEILEYLLSLNSWEVLVATFVLWENLDLALKILKARFHLQISQVQVNKWQPLGRTHYLKALNPIFILQAKR